MMSSQKQSATSTTSAAASANVANLKAAVSTSSSAAPTTTTTMASTGAKVTAKPVEQLSSNKERCRSSSTVRSLNFDDPELDKKAVSPPREKRDEPKGKISPLKEQPTSKSIPNVATAPTTTTKPSSTVKKDVVAPVVSSKPISSPAVVSASKPPHSSSPKQVAAAAIESDAGKAHGSPSKGSLKKMHQQSAVKAEEPPKPALHKASSVPGPSPQVTVPAVPATPSSHPISQLATPVITTAAASPTATTAPPAAVVLRPSSGTNLQKSASYRKSSYKPQHSHSLRYSGSGSDISNLVRVRNSTLGNSAPTLSITSKEGGFGQRRSTSSSSARSGAVARHRLSFVANISPRSHSPIPASPIDSPRINSPSIIHFPFMPIKRITNKNSDSRRWSVASLPSSGYVTTPGSSNISSQCSSQEKLHQFPPVPTNDDLHMLSLHFSSNDSNPGMDGRNPHHHHGFHHHHHHQHHHHSLQHTGTSFNPPVSPLAPHYQHSPQPLSLQSHATHCNSPHSVKSTGSCKDELNNVCGCRSPIHRPRSRSLSSPSHSPITDNEISLMNTFYKERFPKATQQMEERLSHFINENKNIINDSARISQPIVRFVHHQVLEMARDCLHKSHAKLITSRYFYEMNENLERLLMETKEKSPEAAPEITGVIKKLLLIISRPARLLECLEFDPEEFYRLLEVAEGQAKITQGIKADIPQYIIQKLGLNRDPIAELQEELIESASLNSSINTNCDSSDNNNSSSPNSQSLSGSGKGVSSLNRSGSITCSTPKGAGSLNSSLNTINNNNSTVTSGGGASAGNKSFKARNANSAVPSEKDYDILKLISNGAYGAVYLVKHKQTRQRFAMKKINKNSLMLRNQVEQVFAERDILSFADNPFVVSMYCSFETKKHLCLVMEYVEGGDCATLLKNIGPLPSDMARFYFAETVLAVEYLHSYGIVHRDLKPDNLLITALGHIKLTDFGLSKMGLMSLATNLYEGYLDSETRQFSDKQVFGTPEYIAPEVILRQGYGKPVDWWSMGIILYEFMIGCVPFFGETPEELFAHTVNDDIEWPDNDDWPIQDEAKDLISALLQQNPRDRLGTGGAHEVKEHCYFFGLDWNNLLRQKAEFVPQLDNEEDTSYFDTRVDRYNHDICGDDTDDMEDSPLFGSFSSYSPQYRKQQNITAAGGGSPSILAQPEPPLAAPLPGTNLPLALAKEKQQLPSLFEDGFDVTANPQKSGAGDISKLIITPELRKFNINPSKYKMPSTPDLEYLPELATPDREDFISHLNLRPHIHQPVPTTPETPETNKRFSDFYPLSSLKQLSTPESSQTDSDDVSPQIQRKRKIVHSRGILPKFSISIEDDQSGHETSSSTPSQVVASSPSSSLNNLNQSRHIVKSASALGLSLMTSSDDSSTAITTIGGGGGGGLHNVTTTASNLSSSSGCSTGITTMHSAGNCSSTASSRDTSPCRELSPLVTNLKPPLIIRRGPRGFGFTVHTIRVYYGDTDFYTMHHLVMAVDEGSPAFEAGLRPADLITHVNGEAVQGLYHTQVLQLLLSGAELVSLRATPLEHTSIQSGGRKREPWQSKFAKKSTHSRRKQKKDNEKKRKTSLFRRISSKRASAEMQQMVAGIQSPTSVPPSRSFQSFTRFQGSQPNLAGAAAAVVASGSALPASIQPVPSTSLTASPVNRLSLSPLNTINAGAYQSSPSSSPSTSAPSTPTGTLTYNDGAPLYQRPSTLHVLKHKLHSSPCGANSKALHTASATGRPNRRKSADHMPLSPLARTPSPSPLPASPTRSSSPLAFPVVHPLGSSNTTQSYSPGVLPNASSVTPPVVPGIVTLGGSPTPPTKKGFPRAKTAEPSSPLLRRALSPDRLHPRSAESKCVLSPLCCNTPLKTPRQVPGIWRSNQNSTITTATPPSSTAGPVTTAPSAASNPATSQQQQQQQQQIVTSAAPTASSNTATNTVASKVVTSAPLTTTTNTVAASSTASSTGTSSSSSGSSNPKQLTSMVDRMSIKEDKQ